MVYILIFNKIFIICLILFKNICGIFYFIGYMLILVEVDRIGKGFLNYFELIFIRYLL